jgi:hypothetical protein
MFHENISSSQDMRRAGELAARGALQRLAYNSCQMRRNLFRILAVALLALAVPLQGVAALVAAQCMAYGHHQAADGAQDHAASPQDHHGDPQHGAEAGNSAHCGPCAACCASASITGPARFSIPVLPATAKYVLAQLPPPGVQPSPFDRPPLAL